MRLIVLLLLVCPTAVAQAITFDVEFATPAPMSGRIAMPEDLVFALFEVEGARLRADWARLERSEVANYPENPWVSGGAGKEAPSRLVVEDDDVVLRLGKSALAGLLVSGRGCQAVTVDAASLLGHGGDLTQVRHLARLAFDRPWIHPAGQFDLAPATVWQGATVMLEGHCASLRMELYNVTGSLTTPEDEFALSNGPLATNGPAEASPVHVYDMIELRDVTFVAPLDAGNGFLVVDGPVFVNGEVILPAASGNLSGTGGRILADGTWLFNGELMLRDFGAGAGGLTRALGATDDALLAVNSEPIEWQVIATPATIISAAAVVAGVAALLTKHAFATALFTRLSPKEALEHPRRQTLLEYIQANPGATFRELCRATGIPAGTCRHHLSVLDRSQVIVEHRHRSTVRFFENHGKFDKSWQEVVMLRDPELERLHGWIREHASTVQKDILEHALDAWGWSRSTTQHRLQRLVDNGLVQIQEMGRRKLYSLAQ